VQKVYEIRLKLVNPRDSF